MYIQRHFDNLGKYLQPNKVLVIFGPRQVGKTTLIKTFLNTTSYESFGVAVLEAASCGIPIVSSSVGEIPLIWTHESNMLMAETLEPESFSAQVTKIFKNKEGAKQLAIHARKNAETYDWENIKSFWINLLS